MSKILLFANTDWYLYNFRLSLAKNLRDQGHEVILVSPPGDFQELLQQDGFSWIPFELSRQSINPFGELVAIWRLILLYRKIRPDIVHHFTIKPVIYGSMAAHLTGIAGIINSITGLGHLFINTDRATRLLRAIASRLYRMNLYDTQVIFENPEDRDIFIQKQLIKDEQSHLILGTGVDVEKYRPTDRSNETPVVLFSSRMLVTKGLLEYIEAARTLRQKGLNTRFALAGRTDPGNPASIPDEQINAWKQSETLEWWGWQDDMPAALAQADIFCLPSYREGVPNALLEAAACGLSIVTTDVPGCRDVVMNGVNGWLVPVRNAEALANALETLITNPELRRRMGNAGREIAMNQFSMAKVNRETLAVYKLAFDHAACHKS
ncbi:MAG TPA: glycosyltransferase family 4 protein [Anaerolineales bacterium]|nr:glycosyltransferase family 4 protein [Anaerolineales bacterium]